MFQYKLKPEFRKQLKNPDLFEKGMDKVYWGLIVTMAGVALMFILYFQDPVNVLKPTWILFIGLGMCAWGEFQKYKGKGSL